MKLELDCYERRAVDKALVERRARLIERVGDTTEIPSCSPIWGRRTNGNRICFAQEFGWADPRNLTFEHIEDLAVARHSSNGRKIKKMAQDHRRDGRVSRGKATRASF